MPGMPLRGERILRYVAAFCPHCHEEEPHRPLAEERLLQCCVHVGTVREQGAGSGEQVAHQCARRAERRDEAAVRALRAHDQKTARAAQPPEYTAPSP